MRAAAALLCFSLAACTQFPELDDVVAPSVKSADYPALLPLEPLLDRAQPVVSDPALTADTLERRIAALRARARTLQQRPVVDAATRARMQARLG